MTTLNLPKGNIYLLNANNNVIENLIAVYDAVLSFNRDFENCGLSYLEDDGFAVTMINGRFYFNTANDGCFSMSANPYLGKKYLSFL